MRMTGGWCFRSLTPSKLGNIKLSASRKTVCDHQQKELTRVHWLRGKSPRFQLRFLLSYRAVNGSDRVASG